MSSQTSCSSHSCRRRQQVDGLGYSSGKSCQRAPVRKIHRIPSKHGRLGLHGWPPFFDLGSGGKEVVDLDVEAKEAMGLVIQSDQFPDWLFAPTKRAKALFIKFRLLICDNG